MTSRGSVDRQAAALQTAVYGSVARHDPALSPRSVTLKVGGRVVAVLDILSKEIEHAGERWQASGLSWVLTHPEARGHGYGRALVRKAREQLLEEPIDLVLFTCDRPLQHFYVSSGFELLPGTVLVGGTPEMPFASDRPGFDKVTIGCFVSGRARARRSVFQGARIAIHTGDIDKLW